MQETETHRLWLFWSAIRHAFSWYSIRMYWECYDFDEDPVALFYLRWLGGMRWGHIFWDDDHSPDPARRPGVTESLPAGDLDDRQPTAHIFKE